MKHHKIIKRQRTQLCRNSTKSTGKKKGQIYAIKTGN